MISGYLAAMVKGDKRIIRGWTMYDWANSVYSLTITSAVFPIFYNAITITDGNDRVLQAYGIPTQSLYSYALSAGFLLVALISPILSGIADSTGQKKTFLKAFCYMGAASCAGLFFFSLENLWFGLLLVMLACAAFSGSLVFYDAFLPEIAEPKDHDRISARGYTMGYIGSVLLLILNLLMVMDPDGDGVTLLGLSDRMTLFGTEWNGVPARLTFVTVGLWWAGFAQLAFRVLPDDQYGRKPQGNIIANGYRELRKTWKELQSTKRLNSYLMAFFVLNMGIQTVMYLAVTYAKEEIEQRGPNGEVLPIGDDSLIISILLIQLVAVAGAFLFVWLSKRFGNIGALMIGAAAWILLCVGAYSIHWAHEFYMLACGVGLVMGGSQALSRSTYSKFLPETIDHASYFAFYDVSFYVSTVLGTFAYGLVYQLTGDLRNTVIIIGSFFIVGFVLLFMVPSKEVALVVAED
ncbi:MAG: MFS transporter [Flavobacteriales bacterium]|nr:MFS transporter [Flavobacteriales bacterium]